MIQVRPLEEDSFASWAALLLDTFGGDGEDQDAARQIRSGMDLDRCLAAFDGTLVVGSANSLAAPLVLPFGASARIAAVASVTVRSTHRRRGILTALMRRQLDDLHERGDVLAGLWASEAAIYPRFGYGIGTYGARLRIRRQASAFGSPQRVERVAEVDRDEARRLLPGIQAKAAPGHPGFMVRAEGHWNEAFYDPPSWRDGAGRQRWVVHEDGSGPDGYACYRTRPQRGPEGERESILEVLELHALTPAAYAALWRYCLDVDLIDQVTAWHRSVDEPLRHLMLDARALRMRCDDGMWLRLVDVEAALRTRAYGAEGRLVLEVVDGFCRWNTGRLLLEAAAGEVHVSPTRRDPDLVLDAAALASLYLGANRTATLRWAGRLEERRPGAAGHADRLFAAEATPWNPTGF